MMHENQSLVEAARLIARVSGGEQNSGYVPEVRQSGQVVKGPQYAYWDDKVVIFAGRDDLSLEIVIRENVTSSGLSNPAVMVDEKGKMFRWHGEMNYVREHIADKCRAVCGLLEKGGKA